MKRGASGPRTPHGHQAKEKNFLFLRVILEIRDELMIK